MNSDSMPFKPFVHELDDSNKKAQTVPIQKVFRKAPSVSYKTKNLLDKIQKSRQSANNVTEKNSAAGMQISFANVDTKARVDLTKKRDRSVSPIGRNISDKLHQQFTHGQDAQGYKKPSPKLSKKTEDLIKKVKAKNSQGSKTAPSTNGASDLIEAINLKRNSGVAGKMMTRASSNATGENGAILSVTSFNENSEKVAEILSRSSAKDRYGELLAPGKKLQLPVKLRRVYEIFEQIDST